MASETTPTTGRKARVRRRAAGYGRVSDEGGRGDKLRSPELQTNTMEAFCRAEGIDLDEVVIEVDQQGSKTYESVELERLIRRLEAGELDYIVVPRLDRISRLKARQRAELVERIGDERLLSATEPSDVTTPEGRFIRELFFSLARMEWEQKAGNFEAAKRHAIAAGVSVAKRPAFGLAFDSKHRYVPGPDAGTLVALFEFRAAGGSLGEVADLYERRTGRRTAPSTIATMLANRVYLGELRHGAHVNPTAHDAIVSVELFDRVQAVSAERAAPTGWNGRRQTLLAGIAKCEACDAGLTKSTSNGGASVVYRCPNRKCTARASIGLDLLDRYVVDAVVAWAGPVADELVELEFELGHRGERVVLEHKLEEAERALAAYEADVELELEVGDAAYRVGRRARVELVERRRAELEAAGEATELELVRGTLRSVLADTGEYDVDERRRLLAVAIGTLTVRRTPYFGAAPSERVRLLFADEISVAAETVRDEDGAELVENTAA